MLWKAPLVGDADAARALVDRLYERGDDSAFEPSDDIARVADLLRSRWPDDYRDDVPENCPWADMPFEQSDRLLTIHVRWGGDDAAVAAIYVLARQHGLVLYDPQGPDVFLPTDPIESGPIPRATAFEWFKAVAMAVGLVGLTYAAWLIPVGWLRWPLVVVAGFVAAAGLFVLGAMIAGALGIADVDDPPGPCQPDSSPL